MPELSLTVGKLKKKTFNFESQLLVKGVQAKVLFWNKERCFISIDFDFVWVESLDDVLVFPEHCILQWTAYFHDSLET
eukprot:UN16791